MDAIERLRDTMAGQTGGGITCMDADDARAMVAHIDALTDALHDAINSPKGVVPASAEPFYDQMRAIESGDYKEAGDVAAITALQRNL